MKTTTYLSTLLFFFFSPTLFTFAQTAEDSVLNRNITIEREYQPAIQDAGKINSLPHFIEPKVAKIAPEYTTNFSKPLSVEQNIHYLASAKLAQPKKKYNEGYARAALGTGFNSLADFAFPLVRKPDMKLDFILNHYGLFNSKAHSTTQAALLFDKKFSLIDFYVSMNAQHEYFKYYGNTFNSIESLNFNNLTENFGNYTFQPTLRPEIATDLSTLANLPKTNALWRMNINTGVRTSPTIDDLRYGIHLNYNLFNAKNGITEQLVELNANIDTELLGNRFGISFATNNQLYTTANSELEDIQKNYSVLFINPYYSFEQEAFDLRLGVKSSFSFAHGRGFSPSPDIRFEWRAVPQTLAIYAGAIGNYKVNSMSEMYSENRFLNPDVSVDDTYTPAEFYFGLKVKPLAGLLVDAYFDYKIINNQYFFVNKEYKLTESNPVASYAEHNKLLYTNRFEAVYSKANQLKIGGRISYNHHDKLSIQLNGAYKHWNAADFEYAWNKPTWELDLNTNIRVTSKINVYGNMQLSGKRYAKIGDTAVEMKAKTDINLGAAYAVYDWLSAFLKINNLINSKYEQCYGYEMQGFNVMAGTIFSF